MTDVVVFTTESREHLLIATCAQLKLLIDKSEYRLVLAVDGQVNPEAIQIVAPDLVVINWRRRGYIHSIRNALRAITSETFIWMEDDWDISRITEQSVRNNFLFLNSDPNLLQVRWSKIAPLEEGAAHLRDAFYSSGVGFSANPSVCRTNLVRDAFDHVVNAGRKGNTLGVDGFENVISDWVIDRGYVCAVVHPGPTPAVDHLGDIESTGRQWHMTQSVETEPAGDGYLGLTPPFWRRVWMICKLVHTFVTLSIAQLFSDAYYGLAFRIVVARLRSQ